MDKIQMVDLHGQYMRLKYEIDSAIQEVIDNSAFIKGPYVKKFEADLAEYLNVGNVVSCGNGTEALQLALMALELQRGDEVIVPSFTFIASAEVIALLGLKPVFVDVDEETFNIAPEEINKALTSATRVIMPVHLFGRSADMDSIMEIAHKNNLYVVEDVAQALGASYTSKTGDYQTLGTVGDMGCTSFFPTKNLATFGDGGAVYTNDKSLADKVRTIANHGSHQKYYHEVVGINSRLDGIHGAILNVKLRYLDDFIEARRTAADRYDKLLEGIPEIAVPKRSDAAPHHFHQYTLRMDENQRNSLQKFLKEKGIPTMVYYPVPMHQQQAFRHCANDASCPVSERLSRSVLSLPMHTELSEEQQIYIAKQIKSYFNG